jgi:PTS system glucose-specific IIA component
VTGTGTRVLAPCPGRVVAMSDVPDPVFADEIVGPGVAIEPDPGPTTVVSPIAGKVVKVHPHAFVVLGDGTGVLVHLGINTVRLEGEGFEVLATQGSDVEAGAPMIRWDPASIDGDDMSPVVPVVVLDAPKGSVTSPSLGGPVTAGDLLFTT